MRESGTSVKSTACCLQSLTRRSAGKLQNRAQQSQLVRGITQAERRARVSSAKLVERSPLLLDESRVFDIVRGHSREDPRRSAHQWRAINLSSELAVYSNIVRACHLHFSKSLRCPIAIRGDSGAGILHPHFGLISTSSHARCFAERVRRRGGAPAVCAAASASAQHTLRPVTPDAVPGGLWRQRQQRVDNRVLWSAAYGRDWRHGVRHVTRLEGKLASPAIALLFATGTLPNCTPCSAALSLVVKRCRMDMRAVSARVATSFKLMPVLVPAPTRPYTTQRPQYLQTTRWHKFSPPWSPDCRELP